MNTGEITITVSFGSGLSYFDVTVRRGDIKTQASFYAHDNAVWQTFGQQLCIFPRSLTDTVKLEVNQACHFILEAYCYDDQGHTALRVFIDDENDGIHWSKLEFSIPAEVASLNQLGHMLVNWQAESNPEIQWQAQTS